jgi:hypothetical protein
MDGYWMFYADVFGDIPMGSSGQMKVPVSTVRNARKLQQLAESFKAGRRGKIYLMASWTQKMCELGPRAFNEYIARNGVVIDV